MPAQLWFHIPEIPDLTHYRLTTIFGGGVREKYFAAWEQVLRSLVSAPPGSLSLSLLCHYLPGDNVLPQQRTRLYLSLWVADEQAAALEVERLTSSPLCHFLDLKPCSPIKMEGFTTSTDILRFESAIVSPLTDRHLGEAAMPFYYVAAPFKPRSDNDYANLDRILGNLHEPVLVEIKIAPQHPDAFLEHFTRYLSWVAKINEYSYDPPAKKAFVGGLGDEDDFRRADYDQPRRKNPKDPLADELLYEIRDFHKQIRKAQVTFSARVFAANRHTAEVVAATVAESAFEDGSYRLATVSSGEEWQATRASLTGGLPVTIVESPQVWQRQTHYLVEPLKGLAHLASVEELKGLVRLPAGCGGSPCTLRKSTDPKGLNSKEVGKSLLVGDDVEAILPAPRPYEVEYWKKRGVSEKELPKMLEKLTLEFLDQESASHLEHRLTLHSLCKHLFVAGVPGSGKTVTMFNLLAQLHRRDVPFLVLEPAKTEYRNLKMLRHEDPQIQRLAAELRVYTPGNDSLSPFRFNPFEHPARISREQHIGDLLACFRAAMPMFGPLEALIGEALEEVYEALPEGRSFPVMDDLVGAARRIMDKKGYDGEVKSNLKAAIDTRLGMLTRLGIGRVFRVEQSVPSMDELLDLPVVVELEHLSKDHACLMTLFILNALRQRVRSGRTSGPGPVKHVTVIEEAHNIVGNSGPAVASENQPDASAFASEYVVRMLAEMRALREGMIIVDQLPSTVAPEVVKNTGTKLANRLTSLDDRKHLGSAMVMEELQLEDLARLETGQAYLYTEGFYRPRKLRSLNAERYLHIGASPSDKELGEHLQRQAWFVGEQRMRLMEELALFEGRVVELGKEWEVRFQDAQEFKNAYMVCQDPRVTEEMQASALDRIIMYGNEFNKQKALVKNEIERFTDGCIDEEVLCLIAIIKTKGGTLIDAVVDKIVKILDIDN